MILTKYVNIKTHTRLKKYYEQLGYDMSGVTVNIKVLDLSKSSHIKIDVKCDICHKVKSLNYDAYNKNTNNNSEPYCCSRICSLEKSKLRLNKKYDIDNVFQLENTKEKSKKTLKKNYGVEHPMHSDDVINKLKQTNLEKYGTNWVLSNPHIQEKKKQTNLEKYGFNTPLCNNVIKLKSKKTLKKKYGVEHPMYSDDITNKIKQTNLEKYGTENIFKSNYFKSNFKDKSILNKSNNNIIKIKDKYGLNVLSYMNPFYNIQCDICENKYDIHRELLQNRLIQKSTICTLCNPLNTMFSDKENQLLNFIKDNYNGEIIMNKRNIIPPYELDIYLPDLNLAFEFNGVYWHNELHKDKNYHFNKTNLCIDNNIQLIHIWEDDWVFKQDIVKSIILNKLGKTPNRIYGRKTQIKEIKDNKLVKDFLIKNHIQGFVGSSIKLGLFYEDNLVSLMTFGKKRKFMNSSSNDDEYELLRFCNKLNTNVIGGASKLFNHFITIFEPSEVITYADRSYSNGNLYNKLGFIYDSLTQPNYYYIINGIRKHRFGFRKDILVKEGFDPNKSEHEIMLERKINRIYNAGNYKYILKRI